MHAIVNTAKGRRADGEEVVDSLGSDHDPTADGLPATDAQRAFSGHAMSTGTQNQQRQTAKQVQAWRVALTGCSL